MHKIQDTINTKQRAEIITKVGPDVEEIFHQMKSNLGGLIPEQLSYGIVLGFLRGKGFSWGESFVGMDQFMIVVKNLQVPITEGGQFSVKAYSDGGITTETSSH